MIPVSLRGIAVEPSLETLYPHHDLLIELDKVERAMENLGERTLDERTQLQLGLKSRLSRLRQELELLAV